MIYFLSFMLSAFCIIIIVKMLFSYRAGYLSLPFWIALTLLFWFLPQTAAASDLIVARFGLLSLIFLATASLVVMTVVYSHRGAYIAFNIPSRVFRQCVERIPLRGLIAAAMVLTAIAALNAAAIETRPAAELTARQPTGVITILRFISNVNPIALFLALLVFLRVRTPITLALIAVILLVYAPELLLRFKRSQIIEGGLVVLTALWLMRGFSLPRFSLPIIVAVGFVVIFGVTEFRKLSGYELNNQGQVVRVLPSMAELSKIDWVERISAKYDTSSQEVINGSCVISYTDQIGHLGLGRTLWNKFVQLWVPGQILGVELKRSLYASGVSTREALRACGHIWQVGTTSTGFTEAYADFNYFSTGLYFIIAFWCKQIWCNAIRGSVSDAAIYAPAIISAVVSVTHGAYAFFMLMPLFYMVKFVIDSFAPSVAKPKMGMWNTHPLPTSHIESQRRLSSPAK